MFSDLNNSGALYYYMNTCDSNLTRVVRMFNCTAIRNVGNDNLKMFHVVMYNQECVDMFGYSNKLDTGYHYLHNQVILSFRACAFINNSNMTSMIYIEPSSSRLITGGINIQQCNFCKNKNIDFIKAESEREVFWQFKYRIFIGNTTICSYTHNGSSNNLISITNGMISLKM